MIVWPGPAPVFLAERPIVLTVLFAPSVHAQIRRIPGAAAFIFHREPAGGTRVAKDPPKWLLVGKSIGAGARLNAR